MCSPAHWLPPIIEFEGDWEKFLEQVYRRFCDDLLGGKVVYDGCPVAVRRVPESQGKGYGFWHCISEGVSEGERTPDLERCKHIGWIRALIQNCDQEDVDIWTNQRRSECCHLLWYRETYLVVLAERVNDSTKRRFFLLKTAYFTKGTHRRDALRRERDASQKADAALTRKTASDTPSAMWRMSYEQYRSIPPASQATSTRIMSG